MRNIRKPKLNSIESITAFNKSKAELIMANVAMINAVTESTLRIYEAKRRSKMPVPEAIKAGRESVDIVINNCKVDREEILKMASVAMTNALARKGERT